MSNQPTDSAKKMSSNNLNRQVGQYGLVAAVAGVGMLALAEPAAGEVVVTRKTIPIPMSPETMPEHVKISMANNGVVNFSFSLVNDPSSSFRALNVKPTNDVVGMSSFYTKALALPRGAKIGPSADFLYLYPYSMIVEASRGSSSGKRFIGYWEDSKDRYLGVRFLINGETHYGWIRLTVKTDPQQHGPFMSAKITGYAYETVANKPIFAGTAEKPVAAVPIPESIRIQSGASLGMLALGCEGIPLWRRKVL